jgi:hypothetical protein
MKVELIEITERGMLAKAIDDLPKIATQVMRSTAKFYKTNGYKELWIGCH